MSSFFFFYSPAYHRHLHPFPTRRSSDLAAVTAAITAGAMVAATARPATPLLMDRRTPPWPRPRRCTPIHQRSEEHTSELQSLRHLVCRLLLEKKKKRKNKS